MLLLCCCCSRKKCDCVCYVYTCDGRSNVPEVIRNRKVVNSESEKWKKEKKIRKIKSSHILFGMSAPALCLADLKKFPHQIKMCVNVNGGVPKIAK